MKTDPSQAAVLLEDILNNADGLVMTRNSHGRLMRNLKLPYPGSPMMAQPHHDTQTITFEFVIPVAVVMNGVDGTVEEVVEWARTGLKKGQDIYLSSKMGGPAIHIKQEIDNHHIYHDYMDNMDQLNASLGLPPVIPNRHQER